MSKRLDSEVPQESRISVFSTNTLDWKSFLLRTKGIHVYDEARGLILLEKDHQLPEGISLLHKPVGNKKRDREVMEILPNGYVFTGELWTIIACLLIRALGCDGTFQNGGLLRSGQSFGFYLLNNDRVYLVRVARGRFLGFGGEWRVYLHEENDYRWLPDDHVCWQDKSIG